MNSFVLGIVKEFIFVQIRRGQIISGQRQVLIYILFRLHFASDPLPSLGSPFTP